MLTRNERLATQFEIRTLRQGRWVIERVVEGEDDARCLASQILRKPGITGVRVIRELWDARSKLAYESVVFEECKPTRSDVRLRR